MARSLAATSQVSLATYNYIALEQSVNQVAQSADAVYVIIHDKEGRVAGYSGRADLQGKLLDDPVSVEAVSCLEPLIQKAVTQPRDTPVLDIAVPVFLPGSDRPWGTVRVALSLEPMYQQIRQTQLIIAGVGLLALVLSILIASWLAGRITRPLGHLMDATMEAAQGNFPEHIKVETGDEVEVLAENFSVMIREILSQRNQLELQLIEIKHLQRYTEKLLTTMNDGLISIDMAGNVAAINPAACGMLGLQSESARKTPVASLLEHTPDLLKYLDDALWQGSARHQQETRIIVGGESRVILASHSLLADDEGATVEIIANLHDITELKRMEARIRQSERLAALGTLAAGMAHEIRNPLSAIKTFVQLLPRKLEKPGFLEKFHRTVPRELERINRLIEDLLELARDPKYHFDYVDIRDLLDHALDLFEAELRSRGIAFHTQIPFELHPVWADADQLNKAFQNLLQNAMQAMPEGGDLSISAAWKEGDRSEKHALPNQNGWISVSFEDTGMGMSPETIKNIFNPFFTTKDTGTGLGLAITHKVISEHGGHIEVESRPETGTCFTVSLPALKNSNDGR